MFKSQKQKKFTIAIFAIYMMFLIWIVIFKLQTNLDNLTTIRNINLIPFAYQQSGIGGWALKEICYNVIFFIPFGIYIEIFLDNAVVKVILGFLLSLSFEVIQYVFAIGASDVTDLIGNTLGSLMGIIICVFLKKLFKDKTVTIINTLAAVCALFVIVMFGIVMIRNM